MTSYRVCFINEIARNERLSRCCQRSILIRLARNPERVIEAAKKRFARLERIRDWKLHAALIEIEAIDFEATQQNPLDPSAEVDSHEKDVRYRAAPGSADLAVRGDSKGGVPLHARPARRRGAGDRS